MTTVDEIKERLDIVEVISAYVPLRKAGRHYKGLCPFHQERTPSFVVFPETGTWRCFGACSTGGDVFSFVMKRENLDFREALELLARKAGVDLAPPTAAQSQQSQYLERLREIVQAAALYYHSLLRQSPQGEVARAYLARRGLDDATVEAFQLGYAPEGWDHLLTYLRGKGYSVEDLLAAGLIVAKEHEAEGRTSYYDRFRHRVMVPIRDLQGHVIGFGARALAPDQQPKYLNTPQTPLFDKSAVLFGLHAAKQAIRARGQAIIVEGYMDVLAAHQHGETNVVASMGTALTEQQLKQLKRFTNTFVLALDADAAGQAATRRGLAQAREALDREWVPTVTATGLVRHEARLAADLRVMTLPPGMDPDDVIRSDLALWRRLVAEARPVVDYFFDLARQELDLSTAQGKAEAVERLAPLIQEVANEVQRIHYTQQLARLIQADERTVERLVAARRSPPPQPPRSEADPGRATAAPRRPGAGSATARTALAAESGPALHCLALLIMRPLLLPDVQSELTALGVAPLSEDDFDQAEQRAVCAALLAGAVADGGQWLDAPAAVQPFLDTLRRHGQRLPELARPQLLKDVVDSVLRLRIAALKARSRQLPALLHQAEADGQADELRAYQVLANEIKQRRHDLERLLNARTLTGRRQAVPSW
ncbi:MAG: DNA primase [Caldilineales bacterium]|nr:DNA primase [Caldilineales bacterium]